MQRIVLQGFVIALLSSASTAALAAVDSNGQYTTHIVYGSSDSQQKNIRTLNNTVQQQKRELDEQNAKIEQQEDKLQAMQEKLEAYFRSENVDNLSLDTYRGAGHIRKARKHHKKHHHQGGEQEAAQDDAPSSSDEVGVTRKPKSKDHPPEIHAIVDEGGVLLRRGTLVVEPSLEYTRSSALRVAIEGFTIIPALNIGSFSITEVDRDTVTSAIEARYGVTNRIEIGGRVPYVYRSDTALTRPIGAGADSDTLQEATGNNLGDIEVSGHYQINNGKNGLPFFIGNLRFKSRTGEDPFEVDIDPMTGLQTELPTGSGFYSLQPSVTAIFPSDPVVFYTNLGYTVNFERDIGGTVGEIDPGDAVNASFGMGFSINDRSSFSLGYSHDTVFKTQQNGNAIANSQVLQVGSLNLGYAYAVTPNVNVNLNIGAGLTDDAPDARLLLQVPVSFDLLK